MREKVALLQLAILGGTSIVNFFSPNKATRGNGRDDKEDFKEAKLVRDVED